MIRVMEMQLNYIFEFYDRPLSGILTKRSEMFLFLTPFNEFSDDYEDYQMLFPISDLIANKKIFTTKNDCKAVSVEQIVNFGKLAIQIIEKRYVGEQRHLKFQRIAAGISEGSFEVEEGEIL